MFNCPTPPAFQSLTPQVWGKGSCKFFPLSRLSFITDPFPPEVSPYPFLSNFFYPPYSLCPIRPALFSLRVLPSIASQPSSSFPYSPSLSTPLFQKPVPPPISPRPLSFIPLGSQLTNLILPSTHPFRRLSHGRGSWTNVQKNVLAA